MREIIARREQRADAAQVRTERPLGGDELLVDHRSLPTEPRPIGAIHARAIDREDRLDAILLAQQEIVLAVVRGHMDEPGARLGGDEIARQERAGLGEEPAERVHRMARGGTFELRAHQTDVARICIVGHRRRHTDAVTTGQEMQPLQPRDKPFLGNHHALAVVESQKFIALRR